MHPKRQHQRAKMLYKRPRIGGRTPCDACGATTCRLEMHEMINRAQTPLDSAARLETYDERFCVMLCPACHLHAPSQAASLWRFLYRLYGKTEYEGYELYKQWIAEFTFSAIVRLPVPG